MSSVYDVCGLVAPRRTWWQRFDSPPPPTVEPLPCPRQHRRGKRQHQQEPTPEQDDSLVIAVRQLHVRCKTAIVEREAGVIAPQSTAAQ